VFCETLKENPKRDSKDNYLIVLSQLKKRFRGLIMKEILNVKYEAKIACDGRPEIEHAWLEGELSESGVWVIHICEFENGKYNDTATYLRPSELEKLQNKIKELKGE
jgi:hypothetical protein